MKLLLKRAKRFEQTSTLETGSRFLNKLLSSFSFFNNVIGLTDPEELIPPSFCENAMLDEEEEEPATFYSLF